MDYWVNCKCLRKLDLNIITTESYVRVIWPLPNSVSEWSREGAKHRWTRKVRSIFSHFVRRDTSHLSKAASGIFGR